MYYAVFRVFFYFGKWLYPYGYQGLTGSAVFFQAITAFQRCENGDVLLSRVCASLQARWQSVTLTVLNFLRFGKSGNRNWNLGILRFPEISDLEISERKSSEDFAKSTGKNNFLFWKFHRKNRGKNLDNVNSVYLDFDYSMKFSGTGNLDYAESPNRWEFEYSSQGSLSAW